jgi:ribosomal protein S18 acetylase RimI-like enzyme
MEMKNSKEIPESDLISLYSSAGWSAYTQNPSQLVQAVRRSSYVATIWDQGQLVGLARCISDGATIMYLQDILIRPTHQRKGLGAKLVRDCLEKFKDLRQKVLLTDDSPGQAAFYESLGFRNTKVAHDGKLNCFVCIK